MVATELLRRLVSQNTALGCEIHGQPQYHRVPGWADGINLHGYVRDALVQNTHISHTG